MDQKLLLWGRSIKPFVFKFLPMSDRQDHGGFSVVAVQDDIAAVAEVDPPFPVLRFHVFDRPADFRMNGNDFHPFTKSAHCAFGCGDIP